MAHQGSGHRADAEDVVLRERELHVRFFFFLPSPLSRRTIADDGRTNSIFDPTVWERVRKEFVLEFSALESRRG